MKKILTGIVTMALIVSVSTPYAFARIPHYGNCVNFGNRFCSSSDTSCQFVDEDGDGICDNHTSIDCRTGKAYNFENQSGYACQGSGYVDDNHDSICDNYTSRRGNGHHGGNRNGHGRHHNN